MKDYKHLSKREYIKPVYMHSKSEFDVPLWQHISAGVLLAALVIGVMYYGLIQATN